MRFVNVIRCWIVCGWVRNIVGLPNRTGSRNAVAPDLGSFWSPRRTDPSQPTIRNGTRGPVEEAAGAGGGPSVGSPRPRLAAVAYLLR